MQTASRHKPVPEGTQSHLASVSLFEDLADRPQALELLSGLMQTKEFNAGEVIIQEGEIGSDLFVLIEGQASIFKSTLEGDSYKVAIITGEQHAFFGEGGLLDSDPRSATIRADGVCKCLVLGKAEFERFAGANPALALPVLSRIARAVLGRLRKTNSDLSLLYNALVAEIRGT
jgi:CRP-like cAMP-binding protein